jgi:hypothetical protein
MNWIRIQLAEASAGERTGRIQLTWCTRYPTANDGPLPIRSGTSHQGNGRGQLIGPSASERSLGAPVAPVIPREPPHRIRQLAPGPVHRTSQRDHQDLRDERSESVSFFALGEIRTEAIARRTPQPTPSGASLVQGKLQQRPGSQPHAVGPDQSESIRIEKVDDEGIRRAARRLSGHGPLRLKIKHPQEDSPGSPDPASCPCSLRPPRRAAPVEATPQFPS